MLGRDGAQGLGLGMGQIPIHHKQHQVRARGHLASQMFPCLPVHLIDPRGIHQEHITLLKLAPMP